MSSVITQVNRLVEMAKGMAELDTSGMSGFSTALIQLGNPTAQPCWKPVIPSASA